MKHVWAPWRMPFIEKHEAEPGCIFCRAASDAEEEHYVVLRRSRCLVMLNLYPYNSGHLMIAPYQHVGELQRLESETASDVWATAQLALDVLNIVMQPDGFNLGVNQGEAAGAGIADHVHLHVVPRWSGDTNFMPVLADAKVMPELLTATAVKLRSAFESHAGPG
ncbi:MAG: HIT family hydrolase [Chloroflexi bacterium]|nr:MAG: HIT family hydrolase [Chloroflexota bacterium]